MKQKTKIKIVNNLPLIIFSIPMILILYVKFGNPSEGFFETVEAIAHFIISVFLIIGVTIIAMAFYVSPEESKRRRECKCCCKCHCYKGDNR